jgi:hypothetical protein
MPLDGTGSPADREPVRFYPLAFLVSVLGEVMDFRPEILANQAADVAK